MSEKSHRISASLERARESEAVNELAMVVKSAQSASEQKKAAEELWLKILPSVRAGIKNLGCLPEEKDDLEQTAYLKLANSARLWQNAGTKTSQHEKRT